MRPGKSRCRGFQSTCGIKSGDLKLADFDDGEIHGKDIVKAAFAERDADEAAAHATTKIPEEMREYVHDLGGNVAEQLRIDGSVHRRDLDEAFSDAEAGLKEYALDKAAAAVPEQMLGHINAHSDSIDEALERSGRLNADRVFAEADDGAKAIPDKVAHKFVADANAGYQKEVQDYTASANRLASEARQRYQTIDNPTEADAARSVAERTSRTAGRRSGSPWQGRRPGIRPPASPGRVNRH